MNAPEPEEYSDIQEIQDRIQNGTSIRRCAKEYGISESTLRGRLKGAKTHEIAHQNQQLLSPKQEEEIASFIRHEETCGRALSKAELRDLANAIAYPDATDLKVSRRWVYRFLQRHEDIKMKCF
jgi:transposase